MSISRLRAGFVVTAWVLSLLALGACASQEKVVRYKPFLTGIDGATFGGPKGSQGPVDPNAGYTDPTANSEEKLVTENPDGTKTLISRCPLHVMSHLERFLDEHDDRTLIEQVISEKTLAEFRSRGQTDVELLDYLYANRRNIAMMFARMPLAEHSPTVIVDQPGDKTWVIRLTGSSTRGLACTRLYVRLERGQWRFLWIN